MERLHDGIRDRVRTHEVTTAVAMVVFVVDQYSQVLQYEFGEVDRVSERDVAVGFVRV